MASQRLSSLIPALNTPPENLPSSPKTTSSNTPPIFLKGTVLLRLREQWGRSKVSSIKSGDPYKALLAYRSTPLQIGYSLAELLMGRLSKSTVPTTRAQRKPRIQDLSEVRARDKQSKATMTNTTELESYLRCSLVTGCGFHRERGGSARRSRATILCS